jgi:hypothetical protein
MNDELDFRPLKRSFYQLTPVLSVAFISCSAECEHLHPTCMWGYQSSKENLSLEHPEG